MVVRPLLSMLKTVVVAKAEVELETINRGARPPATPATENLPEGVVVPMPKWLAVDKNTEDVASKVLAPL